MAPTQRPETRRALDRLRALSSSPGPRREYAAELLAATSEREVLEAALAAAGPPFDATLRPALLSQFARLQAKGPKLDAGGHLRAAILTAISGIANLEDSGTFLTATNCYERSFQDPNGPVLVRAAGLAGLEQVDRQRAAIEAVRLLGQSDAIAEMSGEPAVTAIRVLHSAAQDLPVYLFAVQGGAGSPEALAEALRSLGDLPADVVASLIDCYEGSADDVIASGAIDLALTRPEVEAGRAAVQRALSSDRYDLFGYVATSIAASRNPAWLQSLYAIADSDSDRSRLVMLDRALQLVAGDRNAVAARERVAERLAELRSGRQGSRD